MKEVKPKARKMKKLTEYTVNVDIIVKTPTKLQATQMVSNLLSISGVRFWMGEVLTPKELENYAKPKK